MLVINQDQSISVIGDSSVGPYDGSDDTLVGIQNNSGSAVSAITVSGSGSDLAGFDSDGICTYAAGGANGSGFAGDSYCSAAQKAGTDPGDYAGPGTSFTLDPNSQNDVEVDFAGNGLAAGNGTYFSLEGALTAAVVTAHKGGLSQRYVALGDSVPYGHGLANPYPTSRPGLPASSTQQGPSSQAYPALIANALHLTMSIRNTNCTLTGDDLAISGANGASKNTRSGNDQCTGWTNSESVQSDELPVAQLTQHPATLVTIQAGADDIDFAGCLAWELTKVGPLHLVGNHCVQAGSVTVAQTALANLRADLNTFLANAQRGALTPQVAAALRNIDAALATALANERPGPLTPALAAELANLRNAIDYVLTNLQSGALTSALAADLAKARAAITNALQDTVTAPVTAELANLRTALANEITQIAPNAKHIAVLNYYQVVPKPADFKKASIHPGNGQVDPVCLGLSNNLQGAYKDAVVIQSALNTTIAGAVSDATKAGVKNVQLVDISNLENTHEICTGNPALFSGVTMSQSQFNNDVNVIEQCHVPVFHPKSCATTEPSAETDIKQDTWRTAHPNSFGQQDIARVIQNQLGNA